ncbi:MAG: LUD domain-containing protein [Patescibacteria group bacterium]|nr:LUD domain-containing protein [Patescibacteria group bacterium]
MGQFLDENSKQSIKKVVESYGKKREQALADLGVTRDEYRDKMTEIRQKVFENFEDNLKIAIENLKKHGFVVHEAKNAQQALDIVKGALKGAQNIVKSKSNLGKEIGIKKILEEMGQKDFETDLGDFVMGLLGGEDQHYVLPALHVKSEEIAKKIKGVFGDEVPADPIKLTHYLCGKIREKILVANVGITGANFFTKTGQIVLLENEGNISLVSRLPKKHIVVCGIDKLTDSIEDSTQLCRAAAIFGTGQDSAQYVSIISGPSKTADIENQLVEGAQGAREVHVILVDNGRRKMLENGFEEMLRCISCGACVNFCPVYQQMGKRYGGKFAGSKGVVMVAKLGLEDVERVKKGEEVANVMKDEKEVVENMKEEEMEIEGLKRAKEAGSFKCTLCDVCWQNCPMKISLPWYVREIRARQNEKGLQSEQNKLMLEKTDKHGNPFGEISDKETPDKLYCC